MSEEPSPPDLVDTDDVPLDEFVSTNAIEPEVIAEALGKPTPLFAEAKPLELGAPPDARGATSEGAILEGSVRPAAPAAHGPDAPSGVARLLGAHRDHPRPVYRRQGVIAALALFALVAVVVISFPRTDSTLESGLEVQADAPAPASGAVGSNAGDGVDPAGSDGFFRRSKADQASEQSTAPASTEALSGLANDEPTDAAAEAPAGDVVDPAPGGSDQAIVPPPPYIEVETSVLVGPVAPGCCDPTTPEVTATPGPIEVPTTQTPQNVVTTTTTTIRATTARSTATTATPTTERTTTTERRTTPTTSSTTETTEKTTTSPPTTKATTTTLDTTSSTDDSTTTSVTTTVETTTTATTDPTDTTEDTTTTPPTESDSTTPTAVGCTDTTGTSATTETATSQPCTPPPGVQ